MTKLALERLRYWVQDFWKVILLVFGVTALLTMFGLWATRSHDEPLIEEEGMVVRFGAYGLKDGPRPVVVVRMRDGRIVQLGIRRGVTHHCRSGSRIRLIRRGDILMVAPRGCAPSQP